MKSVASYLPHSSSSFSEDDQPFVSVFNLNEDQARFVVKGGNQPGISSASYFADSGHGIVEGFMHLVRRRLDYLESLRELGDNWISGESKQPNDATIDAAIDLLVHFATWYGRKNAGKLLHLPPKLVMGPIPSGGISIEWVLDDHTRLFLSLLDGHNPELEVEARGSFQDLPIDISRLPSQFISYFKSYSPGYRYDYS